MNGISLYFRYVGISVRGQLQYRASFCMLILGRFIVTGIEFLGMWVLFDRFKMLDGWVLEETALFYGVVHSSLALAEGLGRGFDEFPGMVRRGDFDRLLVRPRHTTFQLMAQKIHLLELGRLVQAGAVLSLAAMGLDGVWDGHRLGVLLFAILGGACLFLGIFILGATLAFWTTESLEILNAFTYGGVETAQFPLSIYKPWFFRFFTFVVPLGCVTYLPLLFVLGKEDSVLGTSPWMQCCAPAVGFMFLIVTLLAWRIGVQKYCSTGS